MAASRQKLQWTLDNRRRAQQTFLIGETCGSFMLIDGIPPSDTTPNEAGIEVC